MCAALIGVPAGKPVKLTMNVAVAAVICPLEFVVVSNVIVARPLPDASALVTGGEKCEYGGYDRESLHRFLSPSWAG